MHHLIWTLVIQYHAWVAPHYPAGMPYVPKLTGNLPPLPYGVRHW